jgi:1,4-dihydroxy-2-naphthoate octaprenyltransferase
MVALGYLPPVALISLLPALASFKAARNLAEHAAHPLQLVPGIKLTILAASLHGLLLAVALAFLA